jgi:hypothetical protein
MEITKCRIAVRLTIRLEAGKRSRPVAPRRIADEMREGFLLGCGEPPAHRTMPAESNPPHLALSLVLHCQK